MNTLAKTVLSSALLSVVIAGTSANAGRGELPTVSNGNIVNTAQKVFLTNTSGGDAEEVISYTENSVGIQKVSFQSPAVDQEINR